MPRIYDCFCFFNEDLLLELRLETLWDVVDVFVISEACFTHAGNQRETHFKPERFARYLSKIRYLKLEQKPAGENDFWRNENAIRNHLAQGLGDAQSSDWIIVSDLDEIPRPEKIKDFNPKQIRADFVQNYYSYYLNNQWIGDENSPHSQRSPYWYGSKITTYEHFVHFFQSNATQVRNYKSSGWTRPIKRWWYRELVFQKIADGGWHFTWMFSPEDIIKKIESTAHQEFNLPCYKDKNYIIETIRSGKDIVKPYSRYRLRKIDDSFPIYLQQNRPLFADWIIEPDTAP
jgi:beta-1,4-mannosyl-glycoprotein beta-1,4-N-acetylglucosaminyltransferase